MADSLVNIAEFRCRGMKIRSHQEPIRRASANGGLVLVHSETVKQEPEVQLDEAATEAPGVLNIARAAQRVHPRIALHAPVVHRFRSNVIRFNEPRVAVMRVHEPRSMERMADDFDAPPAA